MSELDSTLAMCYSHLNVFGRTLLPADFSTPFTDLHMSMIHAMESRTSQRIVIAAPRGAGKTITMRAFAIRSILFRDYEFIIYISQSESLAMMQTENIKRELQTNPQIRKIFGSIRIDDNVGDIDETFSRHSWVAFGNTLVMPRGAGQQVRGLIYKNTRPQLIIIDDLENRLEIENPENRRKNKEWLHSDVLRCVDRYSDKWKILYSDTLKHSDSLLQELLGDSSWLGVRLELFNDDYKSNIPLLYSDAEILMEVEEARRNGTLDILYMELRNLPVSKELQNFRPEYFKYYSEQEINPKDLESIVIVDPAKTVQIQNADSAIVGIGINYANSGIYIRDVVSGKMYPEQIYDNMFEMALRLGARVIGIEVTGLEEFIKQPVLNEMSRRGPRYAFEIVWLKARGGPAEGERGKIRRIGALVPYYRQGYIYHNKSCCAKLESQLITHPRSGLVDVADATAYVIEMLEIGNRYFVTPPRAQDDDSEESAYAALYADTEDRLEYDRRY